LLVHPLPRRIIVSCVALCKCCGVLGTLGSRFISDSVASAHRTAVPSRWRWCLRLSSPASARRRRRTLRLHCICPQRCRCPCESLPRPHFTNFRRSSPDPSHDDARSTLASPAGLAATACVHDVRTRSILRLITGLAAIACAHGAHTCPFPPAGSGRAVVSAATTRAAILGCLAVPRGGWATAWRTTTPLSIPGHPRPRQHAAVVRALARTGPPSSGERAVTVPHPARHGVAGPRSRPGGHDGHSPTSPFRE